MQTELFEISSSAETLEESPVPQTAFLERKFITLRIDQTIGLFLVLLVFYVLTFSWGVEKGKKVALGSQIARQVASPVSVVPVEDKSIAQMTEKKTLVVDVKDSVSQEVPIPVSELPKPVASVNKPVSKPDGKFTIQHVTYLTQTIADREVQKLAKMGQPSFVIPTGKHFLVCIASFQTRQEAIKLLKQLKTQHVVSMDAYVRPMPN